MTGAARTCVVTGSASGSGRATCALLEAQGHPVSTSTSTTPRSASTWRRRRPPGARRGGDGGDRRAPRRRGRHAGTLGPPERCVRVDHFGAVATCVGLRPLLLGSPAPRAVVTASSSVLDAHTPELVDACLAGEEERAVALAMVGHELLADPSSKRAVAPGVVATPMTAPLLADPDVAALMAAAVPMPLGGPAEAADVAGVVAFLTSPAASRVWARCCSSTAGPTPSSGATTPGALPSSVGPVGDWRWLTRYDPRRASGRELILRGLAAEGGGVLVVVVLLAVVGPVVRAATDGRPWWPTRAAVDLGVLLGLLAAGAAVERTARRLLRRRSNAV